MLEHFRLRLLRTIRGRLAFGFGVTVVLIAMIAALAVSALQAGNTGNAEALASVEQEFDGSQRVITAALREIAAGVQYLESGASADRCGSRKSSSATHLEPETWCWKHR